MQDIQAVDATSLGLVSRPTVGLHLLLPPALCSEMLVLPLGWVSQ